ncbi:hypothetical protein CLU79DRAFT_718938 [Phycomyces nitens]|nr:hypothetical protein CLU79DRAFT_718938 [Phycomyces nitens]
MHRLDISESCGSDVWILSKLPMFVGSLTSFTHPWSWSRSWVYDSINGTNQLVLWFCGLVLLGLWLGSPGSGSLYCRGPRTFPDQDKVCVFATVKEKQLSWDQSSKTPNQDWSQMDIGHTFIHPARFLAMEMATAKIKQSMQISTIQRYNNTSQQYEPTSCHSIASLSGYAFVIFQNLQAKVKPKSGRESQDQAQIQS